MKQHGMPTDALPVGKTRVLIVCADEKVSNPLAGTLREKADYDVKVVTNDFETGTTAQKFAPHVMLLDLGNSEIEANRICKSIRDDEELQTMKILAMVNELSDSEHAALIRQGFDGFVEKTAGPDAVIRQIEQATAIIY
jgi:DNA-binding response OmpR family regulator